MKKLSILALLFMSSLCLLTACDDDRDSNPTIQQPTAFTLNEPAYSGSTIDLESSDELHFTCSQPDYGYTAAVTYQVQVSLTNSFTLSVDEATEETTPDYAVLDNSYTSCQIEANAAAFAKAIMQLAKWEAENVPATQTVNVRLLASVDKYTVASNVVNLNVIPYYIELQDAQPEMWYLIGSCIGDAKWTNTPAAIGTSLYPMSHVKDYEYDPKTGKGELTFTGYLTPDGFKLVKTPGSWDDQWGSSDGAIITPVMNDGGSMNICVPEAGYYTVNLNTKDNKLTVTKAEIEPTVYSDMRISGDFNGWGEGTLMNAVNTAVANNHIWSYTLDATGGDTTAKFLQEGWAPNWGGSAFPYGFGKDGGENIPVKAGKYVVIFNDIDGFYYFVAQE